MHLKEWENQCRERIARIPADSRSRAGSLLPCVPEGAEWEKLQRAAKDSWWSFENCLHLYPHTLLVLYAGLAFHEYEDNTFWPQFWRCVGVPANQPKQNAINDAFECAARFVGLPILEHAGHRSFVGSAVYYIGVPISLWDGFLGICDWALWHDGWDGFSDVEWAATMAKRCGGRKRLLNFLTANPRSAQAFIKEMLEARAELAKDNHFKLSDLVQTTNLRREYFEEVPETADFLQRPEELDSLLADRPRLLWRDDRIAVHLPPVSIEGASWRFEGETRPAGDIATEFPVNGKAFRERLTLELHADQEPQPVRIVGLHPFGLFDEQSGRFANISRSRLPANSYRLISKTPLDISAQGWAETERNEQVQLEDGTQVFATSLWPVSNRPSLAVDGGGKIEFGRRERVNLRFYSGSEDTHVMRFLVQPDGVVMFERGPHLVLEIPEGFVEDDADLCDSEFDVLIDGQEAPGAWRFFNDYDDGKTNWEYYEWQPSSPLTQGEHIIQVRARRVGIIPFGRQMKLSAKVIEPLKVDCWPRPSQMGKYLALVLLSQVQANPTWEEIWIARQAVAGFAAVKLNQHDWMKLEEHGYISLRRRIESLKNCLVFRPNSGGQFTALYCGLVNRLHALIRQAPPLKRIEARQERGLPPHLEICWPAGQRQYLHSICSREGITACNCLWNR
jgi:hypothetical protein